MIIIQQVIESYRTSNAYKHEQKSIDVKKKSLTKEFNRQKQTEMCFR